MGGYWRGDGGEGGIALENKKCAMDAEEESKIFICNTFSYVAVKCQKPNVSHRTMENVKKELE